MTLDLERSAAGVSTLKKHKITTYELDIRKYLVVGVNEFESVFI